MKTSRHKMSMYNSLLIITLVSTKCCRDEVGLKANPEVASSTSLHKKPVGFSNWSTDDVHTGS